MISQDHNYTLAPNFQAMVKNCMCFPPTAPSNYPFQKRTGPRDPWGADHTCLPYVLLADGCGRGED